MTGLFRSRQQNMGNKNSKKIAELQQNLEDVYQKQQADVKRIEAERADEVKTAIKNERSRMKQEADVKRIDAERADEIESAIENERSRMYDEVQRNMKAVEEKHRKDLIRIKKEGADKRAEVQRLLVDVDKKHQIDLNRIKSEGADKIEELTKKVVELEKDEWPLPDGFPKNIDLNFQERRAASSCYRTIHTFESWDKVIGHDKTLAQIERYVIGPFVENGIGTGVLISGPPGCGKTLLIEGIIRDTGAHYLNLFGHQEQLQYIFSVAKKLQKAVLVMPNIDLLFGIQTSAFAMLDEFISMWDNISKSKMQILVIGTCKNPDKVHGLILERPFLRLKVSLPNDDTRSSFFSEMLDGSAIDCQLKNIVANSNWFSYNDLVNIRSAVSEEFPVSHRYNLQKRIQFIAKNVEAIQQRRKESGRFCFPGVSTDKVLTEEEEQLASNLWVDKSNVIGSWDTIGGMKDTIEKIRTTLKSKDFVPGMLLYGPPGCGKTMLAKTIAKEMDGHFFHLKALHFYQEEEYNNMENAETLFSLAIKLQPSIIFIDEIDVALGSKGKDEVRHVFQTHMDGFNTDKTSRALVLGTTNHMNEMNDAVLRRFTTKIEVPKPSLEDRMDIMRIQLSDAHCKSHADIDLNICAGETNDFTGSDLCQVIQSADNMSSETPDKTITLKLLMKAIQEWKSGKELTKEEELVAKDYHTAKDTLHHTWCDIGGLDGTISSIKTMLPTMCDDKGTIMSKKTLLLHGPSGCGKTMIANAIAGEKGLYFLDVNIPNLLAHPTTALSQMKTVFTLAVKKQPSAIFMDDVGALMGETETKTCLRDQIIIEMKKLTSLKIQGVIFVGATNQLQRINADFLQMFSSQTHIGAPDTKGREDILQKLLHDRFSKDKSIGLVALAEASKGCNGSDLYDACQRAVHESSNDAAEEVGKLMLQALEEIKGDKKEAGIQFPSRGHIPFSEDENIVAKDILDPSTVKLSLEQICGLDAIVQRIVKRVIEPLTDALAHERLQQGVLLYGPTGCGKTMIATALAKYPGLTVLQLIPTTVTSNDGVRALFSLANKLAPTIIFIDGMHSFMKDESPQSTMKAEFLRYWDETKKTNKIVVLGTTINKEDVDDDIRDRMTLKIELKKPTRDQRRNIIEMLLQGTQYDSIIIDDIVEKTEGSTGRGLNTMVKNAKLDAEDDGRNFVTLDDLKSSI